MNEYNGLTPKDLNSDHGADGVVAGQFFRFLTGVMSPIERKELALAAIELFFQHIYLNGRKLGWQVSRPELFNAAVANYTCITKPLSMPEFEFVLDSVKVFLQVSREESHREIVSDITLRLFSPESFIYRTHKDPQVINLATEIGVLDGLDISKLI